MSYRKQFDVLSKLEPKPKGFAFEKLINNIFDDNEILISNSFRAAGNAQQIDGAIKINNRIFLLEVKWENSDTLAASKLYSFLGKINSKIEGTLGIFISYNTLKENFINAVRDGLRQNCLIIHGNKNIENIIDGKLQIDKYIWYLFEQASIKNRIYVDTDEFINISSQDQVKSGKKSSQRKHWMKIYSNLKGSSSCPDFTAEFETLYNNNLDLSKKILSIYPILDFSDLMIEKVRVVINKIQEEENDKFGDALAEKWKGSHWREFAKYPLVSLIGKEPTISENDRLSIMENVTQDFNSDWVIENEASVIIQLFYKQLDLEEKKYLANKYLWIYCDKARRDKFEQKQFASRLFKDINKRGFELYKIVKKTILEDLKTEKSYVTVFEEEDIELSYQRQNTVMLILRKYHKILSFDIERMMDELSSEYDRL